MITDATAARVGHDTIIITTVPAGQLITSSPKIFRVHLEEEETDNAQTLVRGEPEGFLTCPLDPDFPPDYDDLLIEDENAGGSCRSYGATGLRSGCGNPCARRTARSCGRRPRMGVKPNRARHYSAPNDARGERL